MKTNPLLHALLLAFGFVMLNCNNSKETTKPLAESLGTSYFPLNVGNEWHYEGVESQPKAIFILSRMEAESKEYFLFSSRQSVRGENGIFYRRVEDKEYLYLDFNRPVGDKWQQHPEQRFAHIASRNDTISVKAGMFTNCIQIIAESKLDKSEEWYAPGIGLVAWCLEFKQGVVIGGSFQLSSAIINGRIIP